MAWVRIDDGFPDHPKIAQVGPLGMAMQVAALCYCNRHLTDGFIPFRIAAQFMPTVAFDPETGRQITWRDVAQALVDAGVWEEAEGGYCIHDYHDYQPTREQVLREREAARKRMAEARARKKQAEEEECSDEVRPNFGGNSGNPTPIPTPIPIPEEEITPPNSPPEGEADEYPEEFEAFWALYPRKLGKREAYRKWRDCQNRRKTDGKPATAEELMAAAKHYQLACTMAGTEMQYIMHPKTFLNPKARRWEDFVDGVPPGFGTRAASARGDPVDDPIERRRRLLAMAAGGGRP